MVYSRVALPASSQRRLKAEERVRARVDLLEVEHLEQRLLAVEAQPLKLS
jgi:hypothetical protein